jgi:hypothetical protein
MVRRPQPVQLCCAVRREAGVAPQARRGLQGRAAIQALVQSAKHSAAEISARRTRRPSGNRRHTGCVSATQSRVTGPHALSSSVSARPSATDVTDVSARPSATDRRLLQRQRITRRVTGPLAARRCRTGARACRAAPSVQVRRGDDGGTKRLRKGHVHGSPLCWTVCPCATRYRMP